MEPESAEWELELHRRLLAGQHQAFADLYDQYAAVVFGVAIRVTCNRQAAVHASGQTLQQHLCTPPFWASQWRSSDSRTSSNASLLRQPAG